MRFSKALVLSVVLLLSRSGTAESNHSGGAKAGQAHYYLGGLYWQTGKHRQAADELEQYLKLEPKAANADRVRNTIKELRNKSEQ